MPVQPVVGLVSRFKATPVILHVMVYYYSKLYNTSLPLVYLVEPMARNGLIKYRVLAYKPKLYSTFKTSRGGRKRHSFVSTRGGLVKCIDGVIYQIWRQLSAAGVSRILI